MVSRFFKTMLKANYPEDFSSRALPVLQLLVISILSLVSKFKNIVIFDHFIQIEWSAWHQNAYLESLKCLLTFCENRKSKAPLVLEILLPL